MATQFSTEEGRKWKAPFFTIWTGQAFSLLGSQLVQFALIWHLTIETEKATVLATASLVALLPGVLLSPFIGPLVDRWNRRRIMLAADTFVALVTVALAVLFALDVIEIWHIYLAMFLRSIGGSFHRPAMTSSTSLMVPTENLSRIQGFNQLLNGGLNIISAPLGAILLDVLPMQGILAIDVVTALGAVLPLLFIAIPQPAVRLDESGQRPSFFQDLKGGLEYILAWPGLLVIMGMATLINFSISPAFSLMPLLVKNHFGGDATQLGWLSSLFGVGVIVGGLTLGVWGGFKRRIITGMFALIGMGAGVIMLGLAPSNLFALALGGMILSGIMQPLANGSLGAILQSTVAPEMQGRVFTLGGSAAMAMTPIGLIFAGPISDYLGIQTWFVLGGAMCILMGAAGFMIPALMNIEKGRNGTESDPQEAELPLEEAAPSSD